MTPLAIRSESISSYSAAVASSPVAPALGQRCQMVVRMLAYPVSCPFRNGELADNASKMGRSRETRWAICTARSRSETPTWI